jgi:hypothetical protein
MVWLALPESRVMVGLAYTVTKALLDVAEHALIPLLTTTVYVALALKAAVV